MLTIHGLTRPGLEPFGLEPFDFELGDGECVAVRGPSGGGKTTLLRAIADLDPSRGAVALDGIDRDSMAAPEWRRRVGYLAAAAGWWADTVGAHFTDREKVLELLPRLNLVPDSLGWPVSRLSTGERQRLALARLLLVGPRVLLLDEPTSGLDPDAVESVEIILRERLDEGAGILLVTHDRDQARRLASRGLRVEGGRAVRADP